MSNECRLPLFADCKEVDDSIKCPGDSGYSVIPLFGRRVRVRKDSAPIRLMGCLDELSNIANNVRLNFSGNAVGKLASIVMALSMQLNAYLVQGTDDRLTRIRNVESLLMSRIAELCRGFKGPLGWIIATTPEVQALDTIRVKLRECGRIASSMLNDYQLAINVISIMNHADKLVAQAMYCVGSGRVFRTVDDAVNYLLSDVTG
ncbi:cobalamin adenosyltransferase [Vulcanisaeta sp. JCM 16159]|uniref:cobalamin adenosyltransferase n=1 Tax=Vulcanisaeta sp. JCM 16159 TaxID=1295371 RepID=UPI0006D03CEE|nr:cobalamin adenosyltransferase [Vulcanisaeta sp. JCM 16159]